MRDDSARQSFVDLPMPWHSPFSSALGGTPGFGRFGSSASQASSRAQRESVEHARRARHGQRRGRVLGGGREEEARGSASARSRSHRSRGCRSPAECGPGTLWGRGPGAQAYPGSSSDSDSPGWRMTNSRATTGSAPWPPPPPALRRHRRCLHTRDGRCARNV